MFDMLQLENDEMSGLGSTVVLGAMLWLGCCLVTAAVAIQSDDRFGL